MTTQRTGRTTRDQQTRDATADFDESFLFEDPGVLPKIEARPGMAQYWARVRHGNEVDTRNMLKMKQRGWLPRTADSVPKAYQSLTTQDESFGGVIGTHDLVLMERPIALQKRVNAHHRKVTDEREQAVKRNIFRDHKNMGGSGTGFTEPEVEDKHRVEKGVLLDDD